MMAIDDKKYKLNKLQEEHSALDEEIARLMMSPLYDQLAVQRLKKRKLQLKDEINKITTKLIPDIIA
jgi:hypothetical protein